jgi:hypothetical protein
VLPKDKVFGMRIPLDLVNPGATILGVRADPII